MYSDNVWRTVEAKLPAGISSLRAVTVSTVINNRVLLFGKTEVDIVNIFCQLTVGGYVGDKARDNILEFNLEAEEWTEIGAMKEARESHGVAVVSSQDFVDWCTFK